MTLEWDARGDFAEVVDTLEPIQLYRCGHGGAAETMQAWRFADAVDCPSEREGAVRRRTLTWHLPIQAGGAAPLPGDVIVDDDGGCSKLLSVTRLRGATRYACVARRTELAPEFAERFDLERPLFEETSEGSVIVGWRVARPGVVACLRPTDAIDPQGAATPGEVVLTLLEPLDIRQGDRLRRQRGGVYTIQSQERGEEIGEPYRLTASAAA